MSTHLLENITNFSSLTNGDYSKEGQSIVKMNMEHFKYIATEDSKNDRNEGESENSVDE
jgi:hypothetical protein